MKRIFMVMFIYLLTSFSIANATFISGSTGTDGAFAPTVNTEVALPANGILNYTTVNIPSGVTVTFKKNNSNTPVYILATGDVTIAGTISVNGTSAGSAPIAGIGGPGGFDGGQGGASFSIGGDGLGPGGGKLGSGSCWQSGGGSFGLRGGNCGTGCAAAGNTYGNPKLVPLIGGSGAGGAPGGNGPNPGGGGGGGAILIASSTSIIVNGSITANGGTGYCYRQNSWDPWNYPSGGGSGGGIRLIANNISGQGSIAAKGGSLSCLNYGGSGRIRLEAYTNKAHRVLVWVN